LDEVRQYEGDFSEVLTYECVDSRNPLVHPDSSLPEASEEGSVIDTVGWQGFQCPECGQPFTSQQALDCHRTKKHAYVASEREFLDGTTCIWCRRKLCNISSAIRHM